MMMYSHGLLVWVSRGAALILVLMAALFTLDAFDGSPLAQAVPATAVLFALSAFRRVPRQADPGPPSPASSARRQ